MWRLVPVLSTLLLLGWSIPIIHAWIAQPKPFRCRCQTHPTLTTATTSTTTRLNEGGGPFDFLTKPFESKIPPELREEIFRAEANTPAAKERGQRVALLAVVSFVAILCAFFNVFLSELRSGGADGVGVDLAETSFGWVQDNFLTSFLFLNKVGGGICLLGGAGAGLLAEAELDTKRTNSEKIYEELVRRREAKVKSVEGKISAKKKKKRSGKETKRLGALSEVFVEDEVEPTTTIASAKSASEEASSDAKVAVEEKGDEKGEEKGLLGQLKGFYDKADTLAASQALLLNKRLEEVGLLEKITDETGLKVIGKEEAAKLQKQKGHTEGSSADKDSS